MGRVKGHYIVPHPPIVIAEVGKGEEQKIKKTSDSMKRVAGEISELSPDTVIVITPHGPVFRDALAVVDMESVGGDLGAFGAADISLNYRVDRGLSSKIIELSNKEGIATVQVDDKSILDYNLDGRLDHGALVPLYYLDKMQVDHELVHITYGILSKSELYGFGMAIRKAVEESDRDVVILASGDLSHRLSQAGPYGFDPKGREFDKTLLKLIEEGEVEKVFSIDENTVERAGECGLRSIEILLGSLDGYEIRGQVLSYEDTFGVGYGVIRLEPGSEKTSLKEKIRRLESERLEKKLKKEDLYVRLARESLKYYLRYGEEMQVPSWVSKQMKSLARGIFVSYKKEGELRGCIGTIYPVTDSIALEIIRNSIEAGLHDSRFDPISIKEVRSLDISVDELMEPDRCSIGELDPKVYGVIVESGFRRGLLLPDLEGVDTVDEQLSIALKKAGIDESEDYDVYRFEVIRHI